MRPEIGGKWQPAYGLQVEASPETPGGRRDGLCRSRQQWRAKPMRSRRAASLGTPAFPTITLIPFGPGGTCPVVMRDPDGSDLPTGRSMTGLRRKPPFCQNDPIDRSPRRADLEPSSASRCVASLRRSRQAFAHIACRYQKLFSSRCAPKLQSTARVGQASRRPRQEAFPDARPGREDRRIPT